MKNLTWHVLRTGSSFIDLLEIQKLSIGGEQLRQKSLKYKIKRPYSYSIFILFLSDQWCVTLSSISKCSILILLWRCCQCHLMSHAFSGLHIWLNLNIMQLRDVAGCLPCVLRYYVALNNGCCWWEWVLWLGTFHGLSSYLASIRPYNEYRFCRKRDTIFNGPESYTDRRCHSFKRFYDVLICYTNKFRQALPHFVKFERFVPRFMPTTSILSFLGHFYAM